MYYNTVKIIPHKLSGIINIPPSKSMTHRAIIAASLAQGTSKISNVVLSDDIIATIKALENFGIKIDIYDENTPYDSKFLIIEGNYNLIYNGNVIDCKESGSTLRFLIPFFTLVDKEVTFIGKGKLISRPLDVYYDIFIKDNISYLNSDNCLPLKVRGKFVSNNFIVRGDVSSQFISGLLYVLPLLSFDSAITITTALESKGYVDMTIDTLKSFGITIDNQDYKRIIVKGNQQYRPRNYTIEGDFSQAAFWIVAGTIGDTIICKGINKNSFQSDKNIIDLAIKMGANIKYLDEQSIEICASNLKGVVIDASQIPDIIPVISVMAAVSSGQTIIKNASRLRLKESDRIKAIVSELSKLGADIKEVNDNIIINGKSNLYYANLSSWNDHRIVMAMAIASIRCADSILIQNAEVVSKSYPHFWQDFKKLGGKFYEYDNRK